MKLEKVKICNFRSFGEEQIIDIDKITTIIGNNSSGKTAALSAINLLFSQNSSDRVLRRSDFYLPRDKNPAEVERLELYIETIFTFPELDSEQYDKSAAVPLFFKSMLVSSATELPYIRIRLIGTWERSANLEGSIESKIVYITCPEDEEIEKHCVVASRKDLDNIRVIYVPAVRDPSKQLKNVSGTMMHQILGAVSWSEHMKKDVQTLIEQLNSKYASERGVCILNNSISQQWMKYDSDDRYSHAKLRFNSTNIATSVKNSDIYFSPTVTEKEYTIDEMGDGLRSLFYISMVDSVLDIEAFIAQELEEKEKAERAFSCIPPLLTIIALEEPENHISPQLLGKLMINLKKIVQKDNAQVILSSHSPGIVKRIEPENIRYFRINDTSLNTKVRKITLPEQEKFENQYKYIKEAVRAYPELYFAKLVILGEGDSEEIILLRFLEVFGTQIDTSGISIVPLGGRYVNHFWRLLSDLNIPYITLLDLDREREGGGWGRIKYVLNQLIGLDFSKKQLLQLKDGRILKDEELDNMHTWDVEKTDDMDWWIKKLENYNVYFSAPLDIDFMLLEAFEDEYRKILETNEGPRLSIVDKTGKKCKIPINDEAIRLYQQEYKERVESDIRSTLKKEGGFGITFNTQQKSLMIWYNYFFLNRGKPTTHILAMARMDDEYIYKHAPCVLQKLIKKVYEMLGKGDIE